ncbi:hypothetical protein BIW11_12232, partial [Tropilaelaps mercedesae]
MANCLVVDVYTGNGCSVDVITAAWGARRRPQEQRKMSQSTKKLSDLSCYDSHTCVQWHSGKRDELQVIYIPPHQYSRKVSFAIEDTQASGGAKDVQWYYKAIFGLFLLIVLIFALLCCLGAIKKRRKSKQK